MNRIIAVLVASWLAGQAFAASPTPTEDRIQRVQALVPPVLVSGETPVFTPLAKRMSDAKVPGVSIAVIHQGRLEWARGFGVTGPAGTPVTDRTLFQAASISKPVFALAVLKLVEARKLDLDTNVNTYLKSWKLPDNDFTRQKPVTLREVLSHSAGLTVHGFGGYAASEKLPNTVQILDGAPPANSAAIRVDILPGSQFRYSGGGYVLAQQLLFDVTGVPLPTLMHDSVLAPLGMTRSTYEQPLPAARLSEAALPHDSEGRAVTEGPHAYPEMAPAGLWTTPSDLARYALGVQAALAGKSKVISARMAREMLTPVLDNQGLGPHLGGSATRRFFEHSGANAGYQCLLVAYEDGEGAVVMTNSDRGYEINGEVMRTIAYVYQWPDYAPPTRTLSKFAPDALDRFVGVYQLTDGSMYAVRRNGDQLVGSVLGNPPKALSPSSDHEFFARDVDVVVDFTADANGVVTSLRHRFGGWERTGARADESVTRQVFAAMDQAARRFKQQQPAAGSETAIRKLLAGLAAGKPDYDSMTPQMAEVTHQQLSGLKSGITALGTLKALTFRRVNESGADEYDADFEKSGLRVMIALDDAGRIAGVNFQPR